MRGTAIRQSKPDTWSFDVRGLTPKVSTWLVVSSHDPNYTGFSTLAMHALGKTKPDGSARGTITLDRGRWVQPWSFQANRLLHPRAFVMWKEPQSSPVVESADLSFDVEEGQQVYSLVELEVAIPVETPEDAKKEP